MNQPTLLIVDDTPIDLKPLIDELRLQTYRVLLADSGHTALQRVAQAVPDLVVLDVMMPGIDGFETCRQLKARDDMRHVPIIFCTSMSDSVDKSRGFLVGGSDYMTKPIDVPEALARIRTHLTIGRLQQQLQTQNDALEARVLERTHENELINQELKLEIDRRRRSELEKDNLVALAQQQLAQVRAVSEQLQAAERRQRAAWLERYSETVVPRLVALRKHLSAMEDGLSVPLLERATYNYHTRGAVGVLDQLESWLAQIAADAGSKVGVSAEKQIFQSLSNRERDVLSLLTSGKSAAEVGKALDVAETTIRTYKTRLMKKLDIDNMADLVKFAIRHELTTLH